MHLSGTGIGGLGEIQIMPYTGKLNTKQGSKDDRDNTYVSTYSHDDETAEAGYYQVKLNTYDINVELTATERVAFHKYTFTEAAEAHIVINLTDAVQDQVYKSCFLRTKPITSLSFLNKMIINKN